MPALIALLAALALVGCHRGAPPTPAECARLLDRYTQALLRADGHAPSASEQARAAASARERAATSRAFARCPKEVSRESIDCANGAGSADEIERCLVPVP
ncbi:MAG: hypothetical protein IT374_22025 [Polyangiaceae bacterium]|nr:hypothetical protein [Polyangiaceae bacterium]